MYLQVFSIEGRINTNSGRNIDVVTEVETGKSFERKLLAYGITFVSGGIEFGLTMRIRETNTACTASLYRQTSLHEKHRLMKCHSSPSFQQIGNREP